MNITRATVADIPELTALINSAYRGEASFKGWTTEAGMIDGQRIGTADLEEQFADPDAAILKHTEADGSITGCVYLKKQGDKIYLGMLSVSPLLQAKGIGRKLLEAGEIYAREAGFHTVVMTVITLREELLAWYERRGYHKTGEIVPLDIPENFGVLKQPLDMYKLEKKV
ncbi:GNAT family N-acetyltransferase [Mucilaginibacter psychrotolerans]|uniref:GNAT family N-acetyltransferase n=1 Tax=Mucilaginibacter psychrotolerans TaxID=1524096 RepID=A0A4Y8SAC5_9SPHI|nr:GNAT family N-acetyltransferase [Mucilaginibacter psychrotolerans]TFF35346.1 GNAT family N-acetyltransferase [Mucilaginibacter psychrotolerans]